MDNSDLAARLAAHENAFEGLLDLIPAKFYNPDDPTNGNKSKKRKQTKQEAVDAKRAKLDPSQLKTARDPASTVNGTTQTEEATTNGKVAKKNAVPKPAVMKQKKSTKGDADKQKTNGAPEPITKTNDDATSNEETPKQDTDKQNSNVDEVAPVTNPDRSRNVTELRARLAAKIDAMRKQRKAHGSGIDGAPASREAILEERRKREEARRERKKLEKQARKESKLEITKVEDEPSSIDSEVDDGSDDEVDGALAYGKVSLGTGELLDGSGQVRLPKNRKQLHPKSALQAAMAKKARIEAMSDEKKEKIAESDTWHKALLQADGQNIKDDVSLLKKSVKRSEAVKKKSEKAWKERLSTIAKSKALKQKNREQNLKDRKDSKGKAGGHKKGKQIGAYQGKAKNNKTKHKKGF